MDEEPPPLKPVKQRRHSVEFGAASNKVHPAPNGLGSRSAAGSSRSKNASSLGSAFLEEPGREKKERRKSAFQSAAENMLSDQQEGARKPRGGAKWSLPLFYPNEPHYLRWLAYTMAVALVTAILDPFNLAFVDNAGIYPYYDFWAVTDYIASATFVCDILTKFCLAYKDEQKGLVTDHKSIALRYLSLMFWVDLLVAAPLDGIIAGAMGIEMRHEDTRAQYIALVRWLKVGRLYRLFDLFALIEHKVLLSQFMLMLVRNSTYVFYIVHWMACILFYVARVDGFSENTWLGREEAQARIEGQGLWAKYLYSLYVAMGAFAGVGDEVFYVNSPAETIILGLYLMLNIAIQAYILGTITIVMVKKDVESQAYRGSVTTLNEFSDANELPKTLYTAMREHVELKFYSERTADEQVLQFYPSTIKRKVLRHLYMEVLKDCYLFNGCKARFLDQVLAAVRMELFMPNVPVLNEGDVCNELFLIVDGEVATSAPVNRSARRNSMMGPYDNGPNLDPEFLAGAQGGASGADGEGGGFGAGLMRKARRVSALFMDPSALASLGQGVVGSKAGHNRRASMESMAGNEKSEDANGMKHTDKRSGVQANGDSGHFGGHSGNSHLSSAGGMSHSGHGGSRNNSAYAVHRSSETFSEVPFFTESPAVVDAWTKSVTRVLVINRHMFQELSKAFPQEVDTILKNLRNRCEGQVRTNVTEATLSRQLDAAMGDELHEVLNGKSFSIVPEARMEAIKGCLTYAQRLALEEYQSVRKTLQDNRLKHDKMTVFKFLSAASMGDLDHVKGAIAKGRNINTMMDYDGRTALMLAARENQEEVVDLLLRGGADSSHVDNFGFTALYEAARMGHDDVVQLLLDYKAKLNVDPMITTPALFAAVKAGQAGQVRRFTQVGVSPNCRGFYGRTPLHLAASIGSLTMVRTLVEDGEARIDMEDQFKRTPIQDAESAGHLHVATYLKAALKQTRRDSTLLVPEMERLTDTGMFAPVPMPIKPMNILPKRPISAASNRSSTSARRRALRAASPVLSLSSHGSHRSIGMYRKTVMDTANNGSPASMVEGGNQGHDPSAFAGRLSRTTTASRAAAAAAAAACDKAGDDLSSDDGSENSRGSLPTSVRLSPEPRIDEVPSVLHPPMTQIGNAGTDFSGGSGDGGDGDGAQTEVAPFTLASIPRIPRAPEAWHPQQQEAGGGEHTDRTTAGSCVRPAPPPIVPAELSALYSISIPTSSRTSLPVQTQPTIPDPTPPPPPPPLAESQHLGEPESLPVAPPALSSRAPDHPAHSSPQPSASADSGNGGSSTREPATLPTPLASDTLPGAASPDAPPAALSALAAGVPTSPAATAIRDAEGVRAVGSGMGSSPMPGRSRTTTPVPPLDFSALRAHRAGSPTQHDPPPTHQNLRHHQQQMP